MAALDDLTAALRKFVADPDWQQFHDPKNLRHPGASEAGELVAAYRWVRGEDTDSREPVARAKIAPEAADVDIALRHLCDLINLDLAQVVADKVAKNATRYPSRRRGARTASPSGPQRQPIPLTDKMLALKIPWG